MSASLLERIAAFAASFPGLLDAAELARFAPAERWEHVYRRLRERDRCGTSPA